MRSFNFLKSIIILLSINNCQKDTYYYNIDNYIDTVGEIADEFNLTYQVLLNVVENKSSEDVFISFKEICFINKLISNEIYYESSIKLNANSSLNLSKNYLFNTTYNSECDVISTQISILFENGMSKQFVGWEENYYKDIMIDKYGFAYINIHNNKSSILTNLDLIKKTNFTDLYLILVINSNNDINISIDDNKSLESVMIL
jgi:hypothetical protein